MKINKVMIAGVDNNTSIKELERLTKLYPFVEWGVLFSKHKMGQQRYPDLAYINELCLADVGLMSAHFCGAYPREILEKRDYSEINSLNDKFSSIQLNYNFERSKGWDMTNISDITKGWRCVILQLNKSNKEHIDRFLKYTKERDPKVRLLYDASGGRGTEIQTIEVPIWGNYTGYAGGINKYNIDRICSTIALHPNDRTVWVDLESGARDENNEFSIENAEKILELSSKYIK